MSIYDVAKEVSVELDACPFCKGNAAFTINKSGQIILQHQPEAGVNCPARCEIYCDTFSQGTKWWNTRPKARWWSIRIKVGK